jgi:hypothetical protein
LHSPLATPYNTPHLRRITEHTSNRGGTQRGQDSSEQCPRDQSDNVGPLVGCQGSEDTELDTTRRNVAETAEGVPGNELGAVRDELRVGLDGGTIVGVGYEFVGDDLGGDQAGDGEDVGGRNTEEEGEGVEDVPADELDRERV